MAPDDRAPRFDDEIAEIENRRGNRNLFMILGGLVGVLLLGIVVVGLRERGRLAEEAARPQSETIDVGTLVGRIGGTAVYARGEELTYVEGIPQDVELSAQTTYVRPITYDPLGTPDSAPAGTRHWSVVRADSLPFVVEPVVNPLTGVNPTEFRELDPSALSRADYRSGGASDWYPLEQEQTPVRVTGRAAVDADAAFLIDESTRVRLQGLEGLSGIDSLEFAWASGAGAPLTAFGRITNTPAGGDPLFVLMITTVHPPAPAGAPADSAVPAPVDTTTSTP